MTSFKLEAVARRHQTSPAIRSARRSARGFAVQVPADPRSSSLFRGLLYGTPIGLAMWLMLGALVWRIA